MVVFVCNTVSSTVGRFPPCSTRHPATPGKKRRAQMIYRITDMRDREAAQIMSGNDGAEYLHVPSTPAARRRRKSNGILISPVPPYAHRKWHAQRASNTHPHRANLPVPAIAVAP